MFTPACAEKVRLVATNHLTLGLAVGLSGVSVGLVPVGATSLLAMGVSALLPDTDQPRSSMGRYVPVLPHLVHLLFGHRGATQSIAALVELAALLCFVLGQFQAQIGPIAGGTPACRC